MKDRRAFIAYPSIPKQLGDTLQEAALQVNRLNEISVETWAQMDIPGRFIADDVLSNIDNADFIIADIPRVLPI